MQRFIDSMKRIGYEVGFFASSIYVLVKLKCVPSEKAVRWIG